MLDGNQNCDAASAITLRHCSIGSALMRQRIGRLLYAAAVCILAGCAGNVSKSTFAISENAKLVRAAILTELPRDDWNLVSEKAGTIIAVHKEAAKDPPRIRIEYGENQIAFRYDGGLKSMPSDNGHEAPLHVSPGMPGNRVLASYDESSEDDYADYVVGLCKDVPKFLGEQDYPETVSVYSDAVAVPLTGRANIGVVKAAILRTLQDEEWMIVSDKPGEILIRQSNDDDEDIRMNVVYGKDLVLFRYLGGVKSYKYFGPHDKGTRGRAALNPEKFVRYLQRLNDGLRIRLVTAQFQAPLDLLNTPEAQ